MHAPRVESPVENEVIQDAPGEMANAGTARPARGPLRVWRWSNETEQGRERNQEVDAAPRRNLRRLPGEGLHFVEEGRCGARHGGRLCGNIGAGQALHPGPNARPAKQPHNGLAAAEADFVADAVTAFGIELAFCGRGTSIMPRHGDLILRPAHERSHTDLASTDDGTIGNFAYEALRSRVIVITGQFALLHPDATPKPASVDTGCAGKGRDDRVGDDLEIRDLDPEELLVFVTVIPTA